MALLKPYAVFCKPRALVADDSSVVKIYTRASCGGRGFGGAEADGERRSLAICHPTFGDSTQGGRGFGGAEADGERRVRDEGARAEAGGGDDGRDGQTGAQHARPRGQARQQC
eukprot:589741-Pyramimonas_sp.AAC.1